MATSPLDPSNLGGRRDRSIGRGHGTRALGPSDSSDSGSDLVGAAGPEVEDANLDSDSDRAGTGETASASRDAVASDGSDIDADHIEALPLDDMEDLEDLDDLDELGEIDEDDASLRDLEDRGSEDEKV